MDKIFYHLPFTLSSCPEKDYSCGGCVTGPKSCDQSLVTTTQEPDTQFGKNNLVKNVSYFIHFLFPAIIITGTNFGNSRSVEALREDGSSLCTLPDLPNKYYYHTQSGLVTCGGGDSSNTATSCVRLIDGEWLQSNTLKQYRYYHTSWTSPLGIVLMGGRGSGTTTELLTEDGQSVELFPLKYGSL